MQHLGNKEILNQYKVGFLCSRKVPANIILQTYDWAIKQRDENICVVSCFHSKIEKDVFEILIKGKQPIILVLARGLMLRWNKIVLKLVQENRLLIISPFDNKIIRPTNQTAIRRNKLIAEISDKIFIPYSASNGLISTLLDKYSHKIIPLI